METNLPKHIAFILDGNRRWAKKRGLASYLGHQQGAETLKKLIETADQLGIAYLTFWGGSVSNLTERPKNETKKLLGIYEQYFKKLSAKKELKEKDIRVRILGNWRKYLPENLQTIFSEINKKTKNHQTYQLTFLIAYDGREEMKDCLSQIANSKLKNKSLKITKQLIQKNLWTGELPEVDLVIRTGIKQDPHWSAGFMMWHCANSQFYFTKTLWPDFSVRELKKAIRSYQKTERRLGK
ncbi:MAG: polyprenyl diphosphate synthase [Patescibacteria group bacterium]